MSPNVRSGQWLGSFCQPPCIKYGSGNVLAPSSYSNLLSYRENEREMFYLTTHSTHFIYGYMASDIWLRAILIVRKETRCRHIGYSYRLTASVLLYAPSHRQDNTYHGLCYTCRGALAGTRNSSMGPPHEGSIRRPIAPWANVLPLSYVPLHLSYRSLALTSKEFAYYDHWLFKNCSSVTTGLYSLVLAGENDVTCR